MPELATRLIPISRKQHDSFIAAAATLKAAQAQLQTIANTLLQSVDDELGEVPVKGVQRVDGVYSLVIEVPAQASTG